ncbi:MAG: hypothetical protein ACI9O6_001876 [Glaciecola sp.]|jgi:hypothetical protein
MLIKCKLNPDKIETIILPNAKKKDGIPDWVGKDWFKGLICKLLEI